MAEEKLDMMALREAAKQAREEIRAWPPWQLAAVRTVSNAASSEETLRTLQLVRKDPDHA